MTEWLTREEVDLYLDDRKSKGFNVVQLCLFWGKRTEDPTEFRVNPENAYPHRAFVETDGRPNVTEPAIVAGGTPLNSNDYWDHVDYCLEAMRKRGMHAAVLPVWGRRYVNATHAGQSEALFTTDNIKNYGACLGRRYARQPNILWITGGDVPADKGGDFLPHYRLLAEGLALGVTGKEILWNDPDPAWARLLLSYHPDGNPMVNSSMWFHNDPWLGFNMIETHISRDRVVDSIRQDLGKKPLKPTVLAEGHCEGRTNNAITKAIHIRRQAYQSFFAGAAGHTYGGAIDEDGNGPLFSPINNWQKLLTWEGASQLIHLKNLLKDHDWSIWTPDAPVILEGRGQGELEKLAIR